MPLSRRRKRKDGKVARKRDGARLTVDPNRPSSVTLQDLINVLAYQEYVKDGTIIAEDAVINIPDVVPVNTVDEDGNTVQVGTATPIPGDPTGLSIHFDDPRYQGVVDNFSIDKENDE